MGLIDWVSTKLSRNVIEENMVEAKTSDYIKALMDFLNDGDNALGANYEENYSTLYTVSTIRGETLGKLPLNLWRINEKGDKVKFKDDPRYDILHYQFNDYTTSYTGFNTLEVNRCKQGNTFARIHRDRWTGITNNLEIIIPTRITNHGTFNGQLWYRVFDEKMKKYEDVHCSELIHVKMLSHDGKWGMNPLTALKYNTSTSLRALKTLERFYKNNALSPIFFENNLPAELLNDKNFIQTLDEWNSKNSGPSAYGKAKVAPPGTKVVSPAVSFADAEMIETQKFNSNMVAALYQVPPFLVGNYEASKFASVEQLMLAFKAQAVSAMTSNYRRELEMKLLTKDERKQGLSIEFNINSMLEADFAAKADSYQKYEQNGILDRRYIAELEGFPTEGLTKEKYVSNNHMPVNDLLEKKELENAKLRLELEKIKTQS